MRGTGFEPAQPLRPKVLNLSRQAVIDLAFQHFGQAPAPPQPPKEALCASWAQKAFGFFAFWEKGWRKTSQVGHPRCARSPTNYAVSKLLFSLYASFILLANSFSFSCSCLAASSMISPGSSWPQDSTLNMNSPFFLFTLTLFSSHTCS